MTTTASAAWWHPLPNGQTACDLCPIGCRLRDGQKGPCGTRANESGTMRLLHYGRLAAVGLDPIEKKPLYHFYPGRSILSVAAPGCNLHCLFCQNWHLSQEQDQRTSAATPAEVVEMALAEESVGIAFTYSEPLVWFEFVRDTARLARAQGLKTVLVTNGFLEPGPLAEILPLIDAANVDLKSMDGRFYRKVCRASLEPVLAAITAFAEAGVHLEVTNLLIPGHNDAPEQVDRLVDFVAGLGRHVPLHFCAYRPAWKLEAPPTPRETLVRARTQARDRLDWVYLGNVAGREGRDTICTACGQLLIARQGYAARVHLDGAACPGCGAPVPVVVA
ncbi:MAG: AmmeMemoRadiSam system radical SAM enzyme [bacterium]|nr:AmmeMemoRadiSam system radical SAM enzyme [bacterium]